MKFPITFSGYLNHLFPQLIALYKQCQMRVQKHCPLLGNYRTKLLLINLLLLFSHVAEHLQSNKNGYSNLSSGVVNTMHLNTYKLGITVIDNVC